MKVAHLIMAMACLIFASCYSVNSVKRYGIESTLLDAGQASPITNAPVMVTIDDETFTQKSSRHGDIRVRPDIEHRITWLGGPPILSDHEAKIKIECIGYEPLTVDWFRHFPERNAGALEDRGVIHLGELKLTRTR